MGLGAVTIVMVAAVFVPFIASLLRRIPIVGAAQLIRAEMPAAFAIAMLAGVGVDVLIRGHNSRRVGAWALASFGTVMVVLLAVWLFGRGHLTPAEARIRTSSFVWPAVEIAIGLIAVIGLAVIGRRSSHSVRRYAAYAAGGAMLVAEAAFLIASGVPAWTSSTHFFPQAPAVTALKRVVGSSLVGSGVTSCPSALLVPYVPRLGFLGETNIVYGIHDLVIYDGLFQSRISALGQQPLVSRPGNQTTSSSALRSAPSPRLVCSACSTFLKPLTPRVPREASSWRT
jgi:hypothetical protein